MGTDGAGHFVKTVHNGIEYADMQMIAEVYGILRDGLGWRRRRSPMSSSAGTRGRCALSVEITGIVCRATDPVTGRPMVDVILDRAGQKGTGKWTAIEAQHLGAPATAIEAAVAARNISRVSRSAGAAPRSSEPVRAGSTSGPTRSKSALLAGKIACYAQGFGAARVGVGGFGWSLPLSGVARVWRAGCIIRSEMLDDMARALARIAAENLMFAPRFADRLRARHGSLRSVVAAAAQAGIAAPALGAGLAYFDMMRTARSTANLLQAQRDFFGAHGFERIDEPGAHHGPWWDDKA